MGGSDPEAGPIRVLLVDDEEKFAKLTAQQLQRHADDLEVVTEVSARGGLDRIAEGDVDCVVSDYKMPETDGLEFLEAIRDEHGDLPFILYTGRGSETVASDAISAGVTDYLLKEPGPDQYDLLANRIRNAVERARTARKLEARREWFEGLIENSLDAVLVLDEDLTITYASPSTERMLGLHPSTLVGDRATDYVHPDDADDLVARIESLRGADPSESVRGEGRIRNADGEWRWIEVLASNRTDSAIDGYVVNARDVTEKKRRERILDDLHDVAQDLMGAESSDEIVGIVTTAAQDVFGFPLAAVRLFEDGRLVPAGHTPRGDEFLERERSRDLPEYEPGEGPVGRAFERNEPTLVDHLDETETGDHYDHLESGICLPMGGHGVLTVGAREPGAFTEDDLELANLLATEATAALTRAEREAALRDHERELERQNERLDEFASVVSHDLRNPLEAAYGHLKLAATECDSDHLDGLGDTLDRMDELIEDALALARQGEAFVDPEVVDLGRVARAAWETTATPEASLEVADDLGSTRADETRLQQLFENLFRNSVEHGSTGSRPEAGDSVEHGSTGSRSKSSGDSVEHAGAEVTVRVGRLDGGFFVADDGPGLPDDREQLFEVGYSTASEGAGLGLSIVDGVAEAHGWSVTATDAEGGGARFEFTGLERP